jgi:hypothetical protein
MCSRKPNEQAWGLIYQVGILLRELQISHVEANLLKMEQLGVKCNVAHYPPSLKYPAVGMAVVLSSHGDKKLRRIA